MSLRPLTTGVSAGSSVALALKLLDWADPSHLQSIVSSTSGPRFLEPWSFLLGLLVGICIYGILDWALTLRWCLVQWVETCVGQRQSGRKKELYKLL